MIAAPLEDRLEWLKRAEASYYKIIRG